MGSFAPKQSRRQYTPPTNLDRRVSDFDGLIETWLNRLHAYVNGRWPRLGRWLSG